MALPFVPASSLKQQFLCLGHFYTLDLENGEQLPCRSVLEILEQTLLESSSPANISTRHSDALVIMMNPGSSHPLSPSFTDEKISCRHPEKIGQNRAPIPTAPDPTQYQIMRLMLIQNWHHVRVINLSDIREGNSRRFLKLVSKLQTIPGGKAHSLFSSDRKAEWNRRKTQNKGPVISGWGQNPGLIPLAKQCLQLAGNTAFIGVYPGKSPLRAAHPSPRNHLLKQQWLSEITRLLETEALHF